MIDICSNYKFSPKRPQKSGFECAYVRFFLSRWINDRWHLLQHCCCISWKENLYVIFLSFTSIYALFTFKY